MNVGKQFCYFPEKCLQWYKATLVIGQAFIFHKANTKKWSVVICIILLHCYWEYISRYFISGSLNLS